MLPCLYLSDTEVYPVSAPVSKALIRSQAILQRSNLIAAFERGELDALPAEVQSALSGLGLRINGYAPLALAYWRRVGLKRSPADPDGFRMWLWGRACRFCDRSVYAFSKEANVSPRWFSNTGCALHKKTAKRSSANAEARQAHQRDKAQRLARTRRGKLALKAAESELGTVFLASMRAALAEGHHLCKGWQSRDYILKHLRLPAGPRPLWHAVMRHLLATGQIVERRSRTIIYKHRVGRPGLFLPTDGA